MEMLGYVGRATQQVWLIYQESEVAEMKARVYEEEWKAVEKGE